MRLQPKFALLIIMNCMLMTSVAKAEPPAGKGYTLLFDESFSGDTLNTENWYYRVGPRTGIGIDGLNLKENVYIKDGVLHIVAKHENPY